MNLSIRYHMNSVPIHENYVIDLMFCDPVRLNNVSE